VRLRQKIFFYRKERFVFVPLKNKQEGRQIFPSGSLAASPLHPHPSLVLILSHTRWTVPITQPWRASACIGRQTCQHLGGHYFSPRRQETTASNSLPRSLSNVNTSFLGAFSSWSIFFSSDANTGAPES